MKDDKPAAKSKSEVAPQEKPPESHLVSSSAKENSIFSLTVNEFECRSGKSFGSMNIDELLNSIWNAEGNQIPSIQNEVVTNKEEENVVVGVEGNLPRQGSFSIPTPLYGKTVDEVWEEIHRNQSPQRFPNVARKHDLSDCQESFGEMTLEDFLIKVGVLQEASELSPRQKIEDHSFQNQCGNFGSNSYSCLDLSIGGADGTMMGLGLCHPNGGSNFMGNGSSLYQRFTPNGFFVGESSTKMGNGEGKCNGEKDVPGEPSSRPRKKNGSMELAVERRQRRMIKNRESAARSRARKQAYTVELEMKLHKLREANARLKRILAIAEKQHKVEADDGNEQKSEACMLAEELKVKPSTEPVLRASKKYKTMRRTTSSAW